MILRDRRFRQGSHAWPGQIGLAGAFADFWKRSLIGQEGDDHRRLRRIAQAALADDIVLGLEDRFTATATALLAPLRDVGAFDFVERFSEPFAGRAVAALLGLPDEAADPLARDATTLGLAMAPGGAAHADAINAACARLEALSEDLLDRARRGAGGEDYVARLVREAAGQGGASRAELRDLVVISIFGGVDTTRAQLGFAVALFIMHAGQWTWLRADPDAVPRAIEEVVRTWPTTTWSTREALEDVEMPGLTIRAGETVHLLSHATGTDPAALGGPHAFDVTVPRRRHFGFGGGAHHCLGQFVARTDMAAALRVLLRHWESIGWGGTPAWSADSGNTAPVSLPILPVWA